MASYVNLPTLYIDFLRARGMSFDTPGGGLEGGRNGLGESITIGLSGGPHIVGRYDFLINTPEHFEYLNMVAARMNGSFRFINVPIWTDFMGPFPAQGPIVDGIPHSDGSMFSDGAGYSQATVFGIFAASAALNAGEIVVDIIGASRNLRHSDWMSTYHSVKGWRAWRYWEKSEAANVTRTVDGVSYPAKRYTIAIDVPLRQAVTAGQRIELARPRCVMKFPVGFTLPYETDPSHIMGPSMNFVEAF